MNSKRSSYQMDNQFNGHGETVYVKADSTEVLPVSQKNVQPLPDYSNHALKAVGAELNVLNPENADETINKMIGSNPSAIDIKLAKNEPAGNYTASFKVTSSSGFKATSYSTNSGNSQATKVEKIDYFAITTNSNLSIRKDYSASSDVLGTIGIGQTFQVIKENGKIVENQDKDDSKKPKWVKATDGKVTGWVSSQYIRPDKERKIELSSYGLDRSIEIKVTFTDKTTETKNKIPAAEWCMVGKGKQYPPTCQTINDKYIVAVGPKIFNELYPDDGKLLDTDLKPFSKLIEVKLRLKNVTKNTKKSDIEITEEFYIGDVKAHSFNQYKYPATIKQTDSSPGHYTSSSVTDVTISPKIKNGMMQTGIRYPNASNSTVVARFIDKKNPNNDVDNMDYSIIEFCGGISSADFTKYYSYSLVSIRTNYEKTTRGKLYDVKTGKEKPK